MFLFSFQRPVSTAATERRRFAGGTLSAAILSCALPLAAPAVYAADYTVTKKPVYLEPTRCRNTTRLLNLSDNGEFIAYRADLFDFYGSICTWPDDPPSNEPDEIYIENLETGESLGLTPDSNIPGIVANSAEHSEDGRYIAFTGFDPDTDAKGYYLKDTASEEITKIYDDYPDNSRWHTNGTQIVFAKYIDNVAYDFVYDVPTATLDRTRRTGKYYGITWASANGRYPSAPYIWRVYPSNNGDTVLYFRQLDNILFNLDVATNTETVVDVSLDGVDPVKLLSIDRSKNGRYALWSANYPIDGGPRYSKIYVHYDLQTNRKIVVENAQSARSALLSGNGRYVAMSQDINRLDDNLPPYTYPYDGIGLFDSFTGETEVIEQYACDNSSHSFEFNSCQNTGQVLDISDDGLVIGYGGYTGAAILQIAVNSDSNAYTDVSADFWARDAIERLDNAGIAGQCQKSPRAFCPLSGVRHDVSAIWLVKAIKGSDYEPPAGTGTRFSDVPSDWWAVDWIEEIDRLKVDRGFGASFRPSRIVTRAQFAYILAKAKYGSGYTPSTPTGQTFVDVPVSHWAAPYIEDLQRDGVVSGGCDDVNENTYCPGQSLTRAMAADMIVKAFNL